MVEGSASDRNGSPDDRCAGSGRHWQAPNRAGRSGSAGSKSPRALPCPCGGIRPLDRDSESLSKTENDGNRNAALTRDRESAIPVHTMPPVTPTPSAPAPIRAGIIGTGFIGPVHLEALRRLGVQVQAVCDLTERAQAAAARHGIPEVFGDANYQAMVQSPSVDVVHITAPNKYHHQMALAALRAGKHCVCEKPLAMNTSETAEIVKAAAEAGRVFAVNYNVRFYPAVLQMRHLVAQGELGQIIHVNGSYLQDWLFKDTDYNWRLLPEEGGKLRAVADIGTHWMDTAAFVLGAPIQEVFADLSTFHRQRKRPPGRGPNVHAGGRSGRLCHLRRKDRGFRLRPVAFRQRGARQLGGIAGGGWPQELHPHRGLRLSKVGVVVFGGSGAPLARQPRPGQ